MWCDAKRWSCDHRNVAERRLEDWGRCAERVVDKFQCCMAGIGTRENIWGRDLLPLTWISGHGTGTRISGHGTSTRSYGYRDTGPPSPYMYIGTCDRFPGIGTWVQVPGIGTCVRVPGIIVTTSSTSMVCDKLFWKLRYVLQFRNWNARITPNLSTFTEIFFTTLMI